MPTMYRMRMIAACVVLAGASKVMVSAGKGDAAKGKEVFEQCAVCHNADSDEKKIGPSLKGLFKRAKLKNGKPVNDENVLQVINAGGGGMPSYSDTLSDEEKKNLLAFLKTI